MRLREIVHTAGIAAALTVGCLASVGANRSNLKQVQDEIAGVLTHRILQRAEVSVLVVSMDNAEVVFSRGADRPLIPASNMKLVAVATALELLGPHWDCSGLPGAQPGETLAELAPRILKPSNNALADALMARMPAAAGRPELCPQLLAAETWGERQLFLRGERWPDGSGLSRSGLMSAHTTVRLLWYMVGAGAAEEFILALPTSGVDGTLRRRMTGTAAQGRVRAKTGTLRGVSALSGYLITYDGEWLVFSIIFNGYSSEHPPVRRLQDQICAALVRLAREDVVAER